MKPFLLPVLFATVFGLSSVVAQTEPAAASPAAAPSPSPVADAKADKCTDCSDCQGAEGTALRKLEQEWADAVAKHDVDAITRIESDDFTSTDPDGVVSHKAEDIAVAKSGDLKISNFQLNDIKVSVYGDAAVVTGKTTFRATVHDQPLGGDFRWTDVFIRRDGKWQVVASQATTIAPQEEKTEE